MWTYLKFVRLTDELSSEIAETPESEAIERPPEGSIFQGFDAFRWCRVVCLRERIGCVSILSPNVDDDCQVIAFAPLNEASAPDPEKLIKAYGFGPCYPVHDYPPLLLENAK